MDALKHRKAQTKAARERAKQKKENVMDSLEFFKYSSALVLHDIFGFGPKRISRFVTALTDLFVNYADRYDTGYLLQSFKSKCKDRGIEFKEKNQI